MRAIRAGLVLAGCLMLAAAHAHADSVQDVRIPSAPGVVLAGTLRLPPSQNASRYPVVLLLGGGGPSRRGVYSLLVERLLARGIATLDYDKRGVGQSTGAFVDTVEQNCEDGKAALAFLRSRPEIDASRIALLGLSLGGVVGPAIAASDHAVAAVVMLSAPVGERGEPFMRGLRQQLSVQGRSAADVARVVDAVRPWMEARSHHADADEVGRLRAAARQAFVTTGAAGPEADGMLAILDSPVLLSMYEVAPAENLRRVRAPILALYGGEDDNVRSDNAPVAKAVLQGHPDVAIRVLPGLNHALQPHDVAGAEKPAVSSPDVLAIVTLWLEERLLKK